MSAYDPPASTGGDGTATLFGGGRVSAPDPRTAPLGDIDGDKSSPRG